MEESIKKPSFGLYLSELWRANKERFGSKKWIEETSETKPSSLYPVFIIPGFMASKYSTGPLRKLLVKKGYKVFDWGLGRNYANPDDVEKLSKTLLEISSITEEKITIIGWSLGGLYARRLGALHPDKLRRVITLAAPYKYLDAPNYARWLFNLFQSMRGYTPESEPKWVKEIGQPLPIPTTAFYTKEDGIVPWQAAMDPSDTSDHENIEVKSSHIGLGANKETFEHLIRILEQDI